MDVGSAKPPEDEMKKIRHHLYSIVDPDYNMTVATYQKLAHTVIDDIIARGKTPIVCGGTGLYLNSILYDMSFAGSKGNAKRRQELEEMAESNGAEYMHQYLAALDPESASRIHPNNTRKVIRAIEAYELGHGIKDLSECELNPAYDFKFFVLTMEREWLYDRINRRVDKLIAEGLVVIIRNSYCCASPSYRASAASRKGCSMRNVSADFILRVKYISYPFAIKALRIDQGHSGERAYTAVSGISQPFSVRTVGRKTEMHIIKLRSDKRIIQPIKFFRRRGEARSYVRVRMYDNNCICDRVTLYLEIPKGVPDERWLVNMLLTVTDKHVLHYLPSTRTANAIRSCCFKIKLAVL
jgi:hypothetical protein